MMCRQESPRTIVFSLSQTQILEALRPYHPRRIPEQSYCFEARPLPILSFQLYGGCRMEWVWHWAQLAPVCPWESLHYSMGKLWAAPTVVACTAKDSKLHSGGECRIACFNTNIIYICIIILLKISHMMIILFVFWFALNDFNWNVFCLAEEFSEGMISCHTCFAKQFRWLRNCTSAWDWLEPGPFAHTHWSQMICIECFQLNEFCLAEEGMISCHTCFAKQFNWLRKYKFEWDWLGTGPFAHTHWSQMICIEWFQVKWILFGWGRHDSLPHLLCQTV